MAECAYIESDVKAFHRLSLRYPGHFYFLRYEDMCRRTSEEASDLWRFLRADPNATTPDAWVEYLTAHEKKTKKKSTYFTTFRNSTSQWYMWRRQKSIANEAFLRAIENNCSVAMEHLGYIPLQTVENVKNLSLPFIRDYSCDFWNCWTHRFSRSM